MHCLYNYCKFVAIYVAITKNQTNKKAPGKGGHHLAPYCPSSHPSWVYVIHLTHTGDPLDKGVSKRTKLSVAAVIVEGRLLMTALYALPNRESTIMANSVIRIGGIRYLISLFRVNQSLPILAHS